MAKDPSTPVAKDDDTTPRKKKAAGTSVVVWILMAMLVLGLGGFGITNFGGGQMAIGKVGNRDISINDYARSLQQEISALSEQVGQPISLQQAQAFGLDGQVRQQLITTAALDNETDRIGVSAGDVRIAQEILDLQTFRGPSGSFDRETYRFMLERSNLTEVAFEQRMREDLARAVLQGAVTGGFTAPAALTDTLYAHISERRAFSLLRLTELDLAAPPPAPTDGDLAGYHSQNIAAFTTPEARRITFVRLLPSDIADKMPLNDEDLRRLYQDRISEFVQPEHRLVERLVYPTESAAIEAKTLLDSGTSFEDLVAARGVRLEDIDLGDVAQADLGAAGEAVFALTEPGVVGPLSSDLGPALFRMNAVLAAQNISFDDARADLSVELAADAARRAIDTQSEDINDRLAGGATLEELDAETDMILGTIDFSEDVTEGIAGYPAFRKAAEAAMQGDFPEVIRLADGGIAALRLDAIIPPTPQPLDTVRDAVAEGWREAAVTKALADHAETIRKQVAEGAALAAFGIASVTPPIPRTAAVEGAPAGLLAQLFSLAEGDVAVVSDVGYVALVQLTQIVPGATEGPEATALKAAIAAQAEQALAQDTFTLFTNALTQNAGISFDDAAINGVHATFR